MAGEGSGAETAQGERPHGAGPERAGRRADVEVRNGARRHYCGRMSDSLQPRRYDEREVRRLLERAAELQASDAAAPEAGGLTLRELESIAGEAGLDATHLRRAALELDTGPVGTLGTRLMGAPARVRLERALPFDASAEALTSLVPVIQAAADLPGHASLVGRSLTWQGQSPTNTRTLQIMAFVAAGETIVRIEEGYAGLAGGLFGGLIGGVGGGVGLGVGIGVGATLGSVVIGVGVPLIAFGGSYLLARGGFRYAVGRRRAVLSTLLDRLASALEERTTAAPG